LRLTVRGDRAGTPAAAPGPHRPHRDRAGTAPGPRLLHRL